MSKGIWRHYPILSVLAIFIQGLGVIIIYRHLECKILQKIFCIFQLFAIIYFLFAIFLLFILLLKKE
jgi:hypothetical protein